MPAESGGRARTAHRRTPEPRPARVTPTAAELQEYAGEYYSPDAEVALRLVVDLVPGRTMERMPESRSVSLCGVSLPVMSVNPFFASAPAAIRLAVGGLAASRTSSPTVVEV